MLFLTHICFALLIGLIGIQIFPASKFSFLIFVLVGSVIPDIDNPRSKLGKKLPVISHIIKYTLGHRGFFHSFWLLFIIPALIYFFVNKTIGIAIFVGYFSHLFLDSLTISGVKYFYPFPFFKISGMVRTGSFMEKIFQFLLIISIIICVYIIYIKRYIF